MIIKFFIIFIQSLFSFRGGFLMNYIDYLSFQFPLLVKVYPPILFIFKEFNKIMLFLPWIIFVNVFLYFTNQFILIILKVYSALLLSY